MARGGLACASGTFAGAVKSAGCSTLLTTATGGCCGDPPRIEASWSGISVPAAISGCILAGPSAAPIGPDQRHIHVACIAPKEISVSIRIPQACAFLADLFQR